MLAFMLPFKMNDIKGPRQLFIKLSELYSFRKPMCREQMDFFGRLLQCVGLRQAALNNLNIPRKNSQLCPV